MSATVTPKSWSQGEQLGGARLTAWPASPPGGGGHPLGTWSRTQHARTTLGGIQLRLSVGHMVSTGDAPGRDWPQRVSSAHSVSPSHPWWAWSTAATEHRSSWSSHLLAPPWSWAPGHDTPPPSSPAAPGSCPSHAWMRPHFLPLPVVLCTSSRRSQRVTEFPAAGLDHTRHPSGPVQSRLGMLQGPDPTPSPAATPLGCHGSWVGAPAVQAHGGHCQTLIRL